MSKTLPVSQITGSAATALDLARAGEVVDITARGKPVAHLIPAAKRKNTARQERALLKKYAAQLNAEAEACIEDQADL